MGVITRYIKALEIVVEVPEYALALGCDGE